MIQTKQKKEKVFLRKRYKKEQIADKVQCFLRDFVLTPCHYFLLNLQHIFIFDK